ncbi:ABC-type multidrug transport system fused ATPase/permease subunit [Kribbella steppae]|uniref:ABC-type multidrug transport system fused ATPase/permease subunit n=1 Tax=Kribbella steppae TaxID=2512223 RepID=A0A4R2HHU7_9ACTN|nr:ABC transporter ATP-binding protein [Kribbella steppae]TCO28459.1 ABC-type multidrug transport system fused ATPase/permease subunit [Kribbella steppae]
MSRYWLQARVMWRACPGWMLAAVIVVILEAAVGTGLMVAIGQFIAALSGDGSVWPWFGVMGGLMIGGPLLSSLMAWLTARTTAATAAYVLELLAETSLRPQGLELLDSPGFSGRLQAVVEATRDWTFMFGLNSTWQVLSARLAGVGAFVVLLTWRWWVPFVLAGSFVVMAWTFTRWVDASFDRVMQTSAGPRRRAAYLRGLLTQSAWAKEVRLFGLADWLLERYRFTWLSAMAELWTSRQRGLRPVYLSCVVTAVVIAGVLTLLADDVADRQVGVAAVVTLLQAVLAMDAFGILGDGQRALGQYAATVAGLVGLRREAGLPSTDLAPPPALTPREANGALAVELKDVTFTYPTRTEPTLSRLSLEIPAGQSIAVVGANGAGKSTLIKLLCGLYRPDTGTITVDGNDPADEITGNPRVAAIFQDFVRYHLPLRDNVGLGAVAIRNEQPLLDKALMDAAGGVLLKRVGWETVLSPDYDGGTELSGGQWQRVALARALTAVAGGAGVLILDEPTAALDVRTEAALFDRFLDMTAGVTTILVTHRLSSVRHAERIVVLDPERGIVEDGSYDALMAADGQFAALFRLQAGRFR